MKIENETDIPKSLNQAVGGAHNAVRLSSASPAERVVCSGRTTVRRPLTDAAVSNRRERNRDHLRALAQRVEVADREVRIMGSKSDLLRTLAAISGVKSAANGVRSSVLDWRKGWDSNPRYPCRHAGFQDRCLKPLGHPSVSGISIAYRRPLSNAMRTWTQFGPKASYF